MRVARVEPTMLTYNSPRKSTSHSSAIQRRRSSEKTSISLKRNNWKKLVKRSRCSGKIFLDQGPIHWMLKLLSNVGNTVLLILSRLHLSTTPDSTMQIARCFSTISSAPNTTQFFSRPSKVFLPLPRIHVDNIGWVP